MSEIRETYAAWKARILADMPDRASFITDYVESVPVRADALNPDGDIVASWPPKTEAPDGD